jgi:hypothetical protein
MASKGWLTRFDEPIVLDDGTKLETLRDAIHYLAKIVPKAERDHRLLARAGRMLRAVDDADEHALAAAAGVLARLLGCVAFAGLRSLIGRRRLDLHLHAAVRAGSRTRRGLGVGRSDSDEREERDGRGKDDQILHGYNSRLLETQLSIDIASSHLLLATYHFGSMSTFHDDVSGESLSLAK